MKHAALVAVLAFSSTIALAEIEKETWPGHSSPNIVSRNLEQRFEKLPLTGHHDVPLSIVAGTLQASQVSILSLQRSQLLAP